GILPPGFLGTMPSDTPYGADTSIVATGYNGQCLGTLFHLLPYVEQEPLYRNCLAGAPADMLSPDSRPNPAGFWNYASFWNNRTAGIKTFLCPSDSGQDQNWDCFFATYQSSATTFTITIIAFGDTSFGKTNYLGIGGRSGLTSDTYRGPLSNRTKNKLG